MYAEGNKTERSPLVWKTCPKNHMFGLLFLAYPENPKVEWSYLFEAAIGQYSITGKAIRIRYMATKCSEGYIITEKSRQRLVRFSYTRVSVDETKSISIKVMDSYAHRHGRSYNAQVFMSLRTKQHCIPLNI